MKGISKKMISDYGFGEYFIHDIPMGVVVNAQNADNFPLISSETFIHPGKKLMIEKDYSVYGIIMGRSSRWRMITTHNGTRKDGSFFIFKTGTMKKLLEFSKSISEP